MYSLFSIMLKIWDCPICLFRSISLFRKSTFLKVQPHVTRTCPSAHISIELYLGFPKPIFVNLGCSLGGCTLTMVLLEGSSIIWNSLHYIQRSEINKLISIDFWVDTFMIFLIIYEQIRSTFFSSGILCCEYPASSAAAVRSSLCCPYERFALFFRWSLFGNFGSTVASKPVIPTYLLFLGLRCWFHQDY